MVRVLFVCMGNVCRSPMAQGVFEELVRREGLEGEVESDSAGTHAHYHLGDPPDPRAMESAAARGLDIGSQRSRLFEPEDCERFDYVLAMDEENYREVSASCDRVSSGAEVGLFLDFAPGVPETEIPDPYYGGPEGFERAMDLAERASGGLLDHIREHHLSRHV